MVKIGVLALQGSVIEHLKKLSEIEGIYPVEIRNANELSDISGLVLPGGESTTLGKLIKDFELADVIKDTIRNGMPVWGTCAGMILLAKDIAGQNNIHLGLMDISVKRNAYGTQLDSFKTKCIIPEVSDKELTLVFIRAPWVEKVWGSAKLLATVNDRIIAIRQDNMLATSFHPELTEDMTFHKYFADMCLKYQRTNKN